MAPYRPRCLHRRLSPQLNVLAPRWTSILGCSLVRCEDEVMAGVHVAFAAAFDGSY